MVRSEAFDTHAREYDAWFEDHKTEYDLELRALRALLPGSGAGIEVGAGTGRFTRPLGIATGVEPSAAMRNIALARGVNLVDGTAESLPANDRSYHYALLVTTICFLDSPAAAFREVHRILEADGYIIIGLIDRASVLGKKYEEKKQASRFYRDATFHTTEEIVSELKEARFGNFEFVQALLPGDTGPDSGPEIKPGHGKGSFVVIRAQKHPDT
jgi:SAM-dependent methyltransferase